MIEENFEKIYRDFRLRLYRKIFETIGEGDGALTATEFFAVETAGLMGEPTIGEFAECLSITSSHAAYKVKKLMEKGYLERIPTGDRRTFRLKTTEKFEKFYHGEDNYGKYVFESLAAALTEEELQETDRLFEKFVRTIDGINGGKG